MESFADGAQNRIDQDLLQLEAGLRDRPLLRRLQKYVHALQYDFMQQCKERLEHVKNMSRGKGIYVPGDDIEGESLRTFPEKPILGPPLVCQLCDSGFLSEAAFTEHKKHEHCGEEEYRKRVLVESSFLVAFAASLFWYFLATKS